MVCNLVDTERVSLSDLQRETESYSAKNCM